MPSGFRVNPQLPRRSRSAHVGSAPLAAQRCNSVGSIASKPMKRTRFAEEALTAYILGISAQQSLVRGAPTRQGTMLGCHTFPFHGAVAARTPRSAGQSTRQRVTCLGNEEHRDCDTL